MTCTLKEMAATFRRNLKREGIKSRVSVLPSHSGKGIRISVPSYDVRFSAGEIEKICFIAKCNNLTGIRGDAISPENEALLTGKMQWNFFLEPSA